MSSSVRSPNAQQWRHDGAVQAIATAANLVGGVIVAWLGTRSLDQDGFGIFIWAATTVTYLGFAGRFGGMQASTISLAQNKPASRADLTSSFMAISIFGSIAAAVLWLLVMVVIDATSNALDGLGAAPFLVGLWLPITAVVPTIGGLLRGRGQFRRSALVAEYVRKLSVILVLLVFMSRSGDVFDVLQWVIAADLVVVIGSIVLLGGVGVPNLSSVRKVGRESTSYAVMSLGAASVPAAALVVVGFLITTEELALLGVGMRVFGFVSAGYVVLVRVATPKIAKAYADGVLLEIGPLLRRLTFLATLAQVATAAVFAILGRPFLRVGFGDAYEDAYWLTLVLMIGGVANTAFGPAMLTLTCTGDRWFVARSRAVSAVIFTVGAALASVVTGAMGVAAAFLVVISVFNYIMWRRAKTMVGLDTTARW